MGKHVKKKIAHNHFNMDIYETTKDLDLDLDRHLQRRIKSQLLLKHSSHFTHYYLAFISTPFYPSKIKTLISNENVQGFTHLILHFRENYKNFLHTKAQYSIR